MVRALEGDGDRATCANPESESFPIPDLDAATTAAHVAVHFRAHMNRLPNHILHYFFEIREPRRETWMARPQTYEDVLNTILGWLADHPAAEDLTLVIIMPSVSPGLAELVDHVSCRVALLSRSIGGAGGEPKVEGRRLEPGIADALALVLTDERPDPREVVDRLLIRRKGVFRLPGMSQDVVDTVIDGRLCGPELRAILVEELREVVEAAEGTHAVLVVSGGGALAWFDDAVAGAASDLSVMSVSYDREGDGKVSAQLRHDYTHVVLIAPVFVRGESLRKLISLVPTAMKVTALCFFAVGTKRKDSLARRVDLPGRGTVDVQILVSEEVHRRVPELDDWARPVTPVDGDVLTTAEFWTAMRTHGAVRQETAVPPARPPLRALPDLGSLLAAETAWMGSRLERLISGSVRCGLTEALTIMPAEEERTASEFLGRFLEQAYMATVVRISRSLLTAISELLTSEAKDRARLEGPKALTFSHYDLQSEHQEELAELEELVTERPAPRRVVFLDEFEARGGTSAAAVAALTHIGVTPRGLFFILDLAPERPSIVPKYSLYSWRDPEVVGLS